MRSLAAHPNQPGGPFGMPTLFAVAFSSLLRLNRFAGALLARGADPNDGESLYHSLEGPNLVITRLLLDAGAKSAASNELCKALDSDNLEGLQLLLACRADPNECQPVLHAARRSITESGVGTGSRRLPAGNAERACRDRGPADARKSFANRPIRRRLRSRRTAGSQPWPMCSIQIN